MPELPDLDSPGTMVVAFGASSLVDTPAPIEELCARYPTSHVIAASTAGEIIGRRVSDDGLVVAVTRFERTRLASADVPISAVGESRAAGRYLAERLAAPDLRAVFVLSAGLGINGSELVAGINEVLPVGVVVTGGLAGDGDRFERTWVIADGAPVSATVSAVALYGESVSVGHASRGGWDIFGPEREVTRSEANVLYELDGKPALALYERYLGTLAEGLPATALLFPLAIRQQGDTGPSTVRTVLGVSRDDGSMTFAGDMPEGYMAQLMTANFERLINGAGHAALACRDGSGAGPTLSIAISCVGRRLVLGSRIDEELEAVSDVFGPNTHQVGFYSYGELSPLVDSTAACQLHNQTMTLTTFTEG